MKPDPPAGLYVHVPFCKSKCPYCDFPSITDQSRQQSWAEAVVAEARSYRSVFTAFDSLYLGGGTPSVLAEAALTRVVTGLAALFPFAVDSERTLEVNPNDVTPEKLALYQSLGINRISVGVQSLNDAELAFLGRRHRRADTLQALNRVREQGPENLSIDLIYGFSGQSLAGWEKTLEEVLAYRPRHLSCYQMTLGETTRFGRDAARGLPRVLSSDRQADFFLFTAQFLKNRGFIHYEISNYAHDMPSRCRHNLKYWNRTPYLGLGPAAHSYARGVRWWNAESVEDYCKRIERGLSVTAGREILSREQILLEDLYLGFRTRDGVNMKALDGPAGHRELIQELLEEGLMLQQNDRLLPTERGFLVADSLPLLFMD